VTRLDAPRVGPVVAPGDPVFRHTTPLDPQAQVVLRDLEREYDTRYGNLFGEPASVEIARYASAAFSAPGGTFLVAEVDGAVVSAGAFMTIDERTVEVKRMWTHAARRGRGLARLVLRELEAEARRRGYTRIVLSTGPRQPEAVRLYLATGYTPLFDSSLDAAQIVIHHFEKELS
jgi:GNAT superfamily N-acetyltransferase